jgi:hypothetical protein
VSVVKPVRPAGLDDESYHGAEAAAIYFLQLDAYMQATGDTTEWEAMSYKTCNFCAARLEQAHQIAEGGYTWTGGEMEASIVHTYEQDAITGIWPMDVRITQASASVHDGTGRSVKEIDQNIGDRRVEVVRVNGRWVIVGVADMPGS